MCKDPAKTIDLIKRNTGKKCPESITACYCPWDYYGS